jgi:hypothetical protein
MRASGDPTIPAPLDDRLTKQDILLEQLSKRVQDQEDSTKKLLDDVGQILEIFRSLMGGFKVLQGLGMLAKPIGAIAAAFAACAAAWAILRHGGNLK